jgi:hypothetical protein
VSCHANCHREATRSYRLLWKNCDYQKSACLFQRSLDGLGMYLLPLSLDLHAFDVDARLFDIPSDGLRVTILLRDCQSFHLILLSLLCWPVQFTAAHLKGLRLCKRETQPAHTFISLVQTEAAGSRYRDTKSLCKCIISLALLGNIRELVSLLNSFRKGLLRSWCF